MLQRTLWPVFSSNSWMRLSGKPSGKVGSGLGLTTPAISQWPMVVSEFFQVGAVEVGVLGDGAEGVGPLIAKGGGIRLCADAEAVQNDQKNALFHYAFTPFLSFCARLRPFGAEVRLLLALL